MGCSSLQGSVDTRVCSNVSRIGEFRVNSTRIRDSGTNDTGGHCALQLARMG